jgi:RNA polymerase sigma-70 factor (ECF subfamily)
MHSAVPEPTLAEHLYQRARAFRWDLSRESFSLALCRSALHAGKTEAGDLNRYLKSLHLEDLALACACAEGREAAWDHFVAEYRPVLYRAADSLEPGGGARDVADSLYADLFGLKERDGVRQSLFSYFHGRSSLATWLRAVLSQRYVDRVRHDRRTDPLPEQEPPGRAVTDGITLARRATERALVARLIALAVAQLDPKNRLRMNCYYAQDLTLAEIGRALGEHEATVSRHLSRARRRIREEVERRLGDEERMSAAEIAECFESLLEDPGPLDVGELLDVRSGRHEDETPEPEEDRPDRKQAHGVRSNKRREGASA